jgi:hypothetical protein
VTFAGSRPYTDRTVLVVVRLLIGLALLLAGRRLYWLFVAAIGFLAGLEVAPRFFPAQPDVVIVIVAAAIGLAGALIAVVAQTAVIGLAGVLAGAAAGVLLLRTLGFDGEALVLVVCLGGAVIGAVASFVLFDWALILLSSLAGASLIASEVDRLMDLPALVLLAMVVALAAVGVLAQAKLLARARASTA